MNRVYETIPYFHYVSTDRYWQMLLDHSLNKLELKCTFLKHTLSCADFVQYCIHMFFFIIIIIIIIIIEKTLHHH